MGILKKRKHEDADLRDGKKKCTPIQCAHRLHYMWANIEAGCRTQAGTPARPRLKANRILRLRAGTYVEAATSSLASKLRKRARLRLSAPRYTTVDYNTFSKNGVLKLTEVEVYFLSSYVTKRDAHEWALVYLGIGNGDRFRFLRDEFFPGLSVIAFDPLDEFFAGCMGEIEKNAELWNNDGTNFQFLLRCFDADTDIDWIKEKLSGKRLLLISDIRGMNFAEDKMSFDKHRDQDIQLKAIQRLRPEHSLVKFTIPDHWGEFYEYAPGTLLKQVFCYYDSMELRLLIDGAPEQLVRYNAYEISKKMYHHHQRRRGQVYMSSWPSNCARSACFDNCFDCEVLLDTAMQYASRNEMDPGDVLDWFVKYHVYYPMDETEATWRNDILHFLSRGRLMEAAAALDHDGVGVRENFDVDELAQSIATEQPELARSMRLALPQSSSRSELLRFLGSLSNPFTLVRSELNGLLHYPDHSWTGRKHVWRKYAAPCWFYQRGTCRYGYDCDYRHTKVCEYHFDGGCWHGDKCAFLHELPPNSEYKHPPVCEYHFDGGCWHGDKCYYLHELPPKKAGPYGPCWYYPKGLCRYGSECEFSHDEPSTADATKAQGAVNGQSGQIL